MTDYFQKDLEELKKMESGVISLIKSRKDVNNNSDNTVKLEQKLFKELDAFGKKAEGALKGYRSKYNNSKSISDIEANKRINQLNELSQSYSIQKKIYDQIINDKYQYVSKAILIM